ncbi:hypothetical protein QLT00_gp38 [Gordonia phage Commandaria]|uniref:Uncharacterized protein n=1 Tax=Gordonia phage Commandaria TaxID=3038364 RepID=A0AAF0GG99_9CAUD|nr:hypothetical protein QLT00_gp38 [Gordonia phage Commandaria]WGH20821.1 hypothetical protein [Gordonia phage Commandaria]
MAFDPIKLIHPKTGVVVEATTAIDLTNFRFNDGYVPVDQAETVLAAEGAEKKYPKLAEGLAALRETETVSDAPAAESEKPETVSDAPAAESEKPETVSSTRTAKPTGSAAKGSAKSGTDASGTDVGVS